MMRFLMVLLAAVIVTLSTTGSVDAIQQPKQVEVISYTVHRGDTLWSIANDYATENTSDIREFMWQICQDERNHNLFQAGRYLKPGDQILIPLIIKK